MKGFLTFFGLNLVTAAATGLALSFAVLHATGQSASLGANLAAYYLPSLLTPPVARFANKLSTRQVLRLTSWIRALLILVFAILVISHVTAAALYFTISFSVGLAKLPQGGAFRKAFTTLIDEGRFVRANSHYSATANVATLVGMGTGGLLIQSFGAGTVLLVTAGLFAAVGFGTGMVPNVSGHKSKDVRGGQRASWTRVIVTVGILAVIPSFAATPFDSVTPIFSLRVGVGPVGQAALVGIMTVSAIATSAVIGRARVDPKPGQVVGTGFLSLFVGVALLVVGLASAFWLVALSAILVGVALSSIEAGCYGYLHREVPIDQQGIFFTYLTSTDTLISAAGFLICGLVVSTVSLSGAALSVGLLAILLTIGTCMGLLGIRLTRNVTR